MTTSASSPPAAAGRSAERPGREITDFMTDGALARLCAALASLAGVPVGLRDASGRAVLPSAGSPPWTVGDLPEAPAEGEQSFPFVVAGRSIGSLVLGAGAPALGGGVREPLERVVALLSRTTSELCERDEELRHRVKEVQALYRLSSLVARATAVDRVLQIALDLTLGALELDAGSIVLFEESRALTDENEEHLLLKAHRNLSDEWLRSPLPVSKGRLFDRLALKGELVMSEDLWADERVLIRDMVEREGLRGCINAGLVFQDKPIGVIRLYSRSVRRFGEWDQRLLRSIAAQAAVAVEQARLLAVRDEDERIQRQMQLAADIQRRMLPRGMPSVAGLDLAAHYSPSFALGGDFYDLFELGGSLGVAIGDVSGKGIAAALMMSAVRATLRAHVQDVYHMDEVIARVNAALCRDTRDNEFATLWYGVVDKKLRLTYCSAGHEPPFVVRLGSGRGSKPVEIDELSVGGMAVGIDPAQRYERGMYDLKPRDVLVAYTDGLPDTLDFSRKRFGKKRLREAVVTVLAQEPGASAGRIVEHVFKELRQFAGVHERPDDQTIVVMRVGAK